MKTRLTILLLAFFPLIVDARVIRVGKREPFTSIKAALAVAVNGDSIYIQPGIYKEQNILITRSVSLFGINQPVLDGEKKYEIISIKASGVVIDGFTIVHSGISPLDEPAAIKIYNSHAVVVRNNILDDNYFGIYTLYGTSCCIENNKIRSYGVAEYEIGNGIHCWKSDSMRIIANEVSGHRDGIYFEFVTHSVIWRNNSRNNVRYGLHFMFSNDDSYFCNIFHQNGSGVAVMFSHGVTMSHNFFEENWGDAAYGLLLKEIADGRITGNYFTKNTSGIYMEGTSRIQVEGNTFNENGWGMKIQASCMDNNILRNDFIANTFDVGTNGSLVLNNFDQNYWDKYDGYDLNKDGKGDVPYRPVSLYSMIVEKNPAAMMLFRSFMTTLLDKTEKIIPTLTPENLKDNFPLVKRHRL
jgi:nitrous oxidase accessory protein